LTPKTKAGRTTCRLRLKDENFPYIEVSTDHVIRPQQLSMQDQNRQFDAVSGLMGSIGHC